MDEQFYKNESVTQYLLGALPEEEAERLDELSFTDDRFAEALSAAENELVDAYVRGELAGADLAHFKSYYLASPLRQQKVQFAEALFLYGEGGTASAKENSGERAAQADTKRKGPILSAAWKVTAWQPALRWGAAIAALALLVAGGWLVLEGARTRRPEPVARVPLEERGGPEAERTPTEPERAGEEPTQERAQQSAPEPQGPPEQKGGAERPDETQPQRDTGRRRDTEHNSTRGAVSVATFVLAPQTRGTAQPPTISLPAGASRVLFRLQLALADYPAYRVELHDPSRGRTLWRSGKLRASVEPGGPSIGVRLRAEQLGPQIYSLRVVGLPVGGTPEIVSDYPFRVVK